jgi:hypothetical protein
MTKERGAAYFKKRLKTEHPAIYADLRSGSIRSVRQAAARAGLIHLPTRLDALKREWKGSTWPERNEFLAWLKSNYGKRSKTPLVSIPITDGDGRLTTPVVAFLRTWLKTNRARPGQIMAQMGLSNHDYRLSEGIFSNHQLKRAIVEKLEGWLPKNGFTPSAT